MDKTTHRQESTLCPVLYVAFELARKEWLSTMSTAPDAKRQRARVIRVTARRCSARSHPDPYVVSGFSRTGTRTRT